MDTTEQPPQRRGRGRPTVQIVLTDEERATLERWARRRTSSQALALRCQLVLACAEGLSNVAAAARLGVHPATVGKWRGRFARRRLEGLADEPRPGAPRRVSDEDVERVVVKTLEEAPKDATHWSVREMAKASGLSRSTVARIWRTFGLKPHLVQHWKLSTDPQFIDKVRDIVGLYLNPPQAAVVLWVDEKSQIQALNRTAPVLPLLPWGPAAGHPRLHPPWHHQPVCSAGGGLRQGALAADPAAPRDRVQAVPWPHRPGGAGRAGRARDL